MEDYTAAVNYIKDTPVYGQFMLWHLILFMILGPTLTWQMLIVLLIVFGRSVFGMFKNALKAEGP